MQRHAARRDKLSIHGTNYQPQSIARLRILKTGLWLRPRGGGGGGAHTNEEQCHGDGALSERPENALEDGRLRVAVACEAVNDEGARVGGGDEVEHERGNGEA